MIKVEWIFKTCILYCSLIRCCLFTRALFQISFFLGKLVNEKDQKPLFTEFICRMLTIILKFPGGFKNTGCQDAFSLLKFILGVSRFHPQACYLVLGARNCDLDECLHCERMFYCSDFKV